MRNIVLAAALSGVFAAGVAGAALAHDRADHRPGMGRLFQGDSDRDGVLTRQEFDAARQAAFARLDTNQDGEVTREEMRAGRSMGRFQERGRGEHRRHGHGLPRGADADNDGAITREEFLARPSEMFARLDANGDGVIDANERPRQRGERRSERAQPNANQRGKITAVEWASMGAARFQRMDANGDGQITQEEARAAAQRRRPPA